MTIVQHHPDQVVEMFRSFGDGQEHVGFERIARAIWRTPDGSIVPIAQREKYRTKKDNQGQAVSAWEVEQALLGGQNDPGILSLFAGVHRWLHGGDDGHLGIGKQGRPVKTFAWIGTIDESVELVETIAATGRQYSIRIGGTPLSKEEIDAGSIGTPDFQWVGGMIKNRRSLIHRKVEGSEVSIQMHSDVEIIIDGLYTGEDNQNAYTNDPPEWVDIKELQLSAFNVIVLYVWDCWSLEPETLDQSVPLELEDFSDVPF